MSSHSAALSLVACLAGRPAFSWPAIPTRDDRKTGRTPTRRTSSSVLDICKYQNMYELVIDPGQSG